MSRLRILAAGALLAAFATLTAALPASAHDELLSSTPSVDERLTDAPEQISLTFSGSVLTIGTAVIVVDQDGNDWAAADPEVVGDTVTTALAPGMAEAGYEVRWRVVGEDGHPLSGVIPFTVGDGQPLVRTPAPAATSEPSASAPAAPADGSDAAAGENGQSTPEEGPGLRAFLIGVGGAAAAVAIFALISIIRRRGADTGSPDGTSTS